MTDKRYDQLSKQINEDIDQWSSIFGKNADRQQRSDLARQEQDAALARLIKGSELKQQEAQAANDIGKQNIEYLMQQQQENPDLDFTLQGERVGNRKKDLAEQIALMNYKDKMNQRDKQARLGLDAAKVNITGYSIADPENVMPVAKDKQEALTQIKAQQGAEAALNRYKDASAKAGLLDKAGNVVGVGPMAQAAEDAMLKIKEIEKLGVLNGHDRDVVMTSMGQLTGMKSLLTSAEAKKKAIDTINNMYKKNVEGDLLRRGYQKQGVQPQQPLSEDQFIQKFIQAKQKK